MDITILASGSTGNCYHVNDSKTSLLLDAGIPIKAIHVGCGFQLSRVSGCLVTHYHGDHSKSVKSLLKAGVDVYMPREEAEVCGIPHSHRLHYLMHRDDGYSSFPVGTFNILPFRVEHDTPAPVGYLIASRSTGEKLLYFTDSYYLRYRFTGLTHIIGEVNYDNESVWDHIEDGSTPAARAKRLFSSHMSLDTFLEFLDATDTCRLRQIYICHMSNDHGNADKISRAVRQETGAEVYVC